MQGLRVEHAKMPIEELTKQNVEATVFILNSCRGYSWIIKRSGSRCGKGFMGLCSAHCSQCLIHVLSPFYLLSNPVAELGHQKGQSWPIQANLNPVRWSFC